SEILQELRVGQVRIGGTSSADRKDAGVAGGELPVIEDVKGVRAQLEVNLLSQLGRLADGHVPLVQSGSAHCVASGVGDHAGLRLHKIRVWIVGNIAHNVGCTTASSGVRTHASGARAGITADEAHRAADQRRRYVRVDERTVAGCVAVTV